MKRILAVSILSLILASYTTIIYAPERTEQIAEKRTEPIAAEIETKHQPPISRGSVNRESLLPKNSYKMRVQVTAYTPFEPGQTSGTGLAFDGRPAIPYHTVAVDPKVIPLQSKVYVPGLGWFVAHDTGSAIKGNIIDVCLAEHDEAVNWGRRTLEIIVVPPDK